jgi:hypothetical protein
MTKTKSAAQKSDWLPISTAPKDGTRVDLWIIHPQYRARRVTDCRWQPKGYFGARWETRGQAGVESRRLRIRATHWRHVPGAPKGRV